MGAIRKTDRRMGEVVGVIYPNAFYDTDAVLEFCGVGEVKLSEVRKGQQLKAFKFCGKGRNWFRGEDILALMVREDEAGK